MTKRYCIIVADGEGGVRATAQAGGWTVVEPVRPFADLDTRDDGTLGSSIGRLRVQGAGFMALAHRD